MSLLDCELALLAKHLLKLFLIAALLSAWRDQAIAGTTGVLAGTVRLSDDSALGGAQVTAATPSDSRTVATDANGYFVFLSLPPDTYKVTVSETGYDLISLGGVRVLADNTRVVSLITRRTVVLGVVKVKPSASLLQTGVVADVYSINDERASKTQLLGGGANIANIYSALSAVPGVIVPPGQNGANQLLNIRGAGVFNAVGYEYDGVPVNRSFDNLASTVGSSLGQRELQVYVGTAPPNAQAFGLGGFINQVIRSGTYPGFATFAASVQSPNLYNGLSLEIGGATPARSFSYYVAFGGYSYAPRYYDNFDGASVSQLYGFPLDLIPCSHDPTGDSSVACYNNGGPNGTRGPGGFILTPINFFLTSSIDDREAVTNLHFRIPHHRDEGGDDVQLLYSSSLLRNPVYSSTADLGQAFFAYDKSVGGNIVSPSVFVNGYQYQGSVGQALLGGCPSPCNIIPYNFPSSNVAPGAPIPVNLRDSSENVSGIIKLQYQHNFGSRAYLRLYGYSLYSSLFNAGSNEVNFCFEGTGAGCEFSEFGNYELSSHTRGASAVYAVQLNDRNLLNVEGSYVTATTLRDNNHQYFSSGRFAVLVDSKSPVSGFCFRLSGALGSCEPSSSNRTRAAFLKLGDVFSGGGVPDVGGLTCDPGVAGIPAGPCEWLVVENGMKGAYNQVQPAFTAWSAIDQIRMSSALQLNAGLRFDRFVFAGTATTGPAREFWFNAWNQNECFSANAGTVLDKMGDLGLPSPAAVCPLGTVPATMDNASGQAFSYGLLEPRLGGTYAIGDNNVLRLSYSKIAQPPNAAYEQFNYLEQNLPAALASFYPFGFNTPGHALGPSVADSLDFSWEHRVRGSDLEFKLTPYLRKTKEQYQGFVLDQRINFSTALPAAQQTSDGVEFELQKGSFAKNGLSWVLIYNYFHNVISYTPFANGATFQTVNNNAIRQYNAYTSFCAATPTDPRCGSPTDGKPPAACYNASGDPVACGSADIANPYWNAPVQGLFSDAAFPTGSTSHTATFVLNYKIGSFSLTPTLQFFGGSRYGDPLSSRGIDPASGCTPRIGSIARDPRYPYGAAGGSPYDATSCAAYFAIPDPYTHLFDGTNAFVQPALLLMNFQMTYDATSRLQFSVGATNLINTCWGGTKAPWTSGSTSHICGYGEVAFKGNFYNPDSIIQPLTRFPYTGGPGNTPISLLFQTTMKL